ncbi:MAG TPA: HlyD family efflux transporter periplasmic adaptor subunit [Vicinamibacterales bacterium]|nr:HlyD family efflux transporter periplasmic adaptor subunit [Vicinamibacterales bacterium]
MRRAAYAAAAVLMVVLISVALAQMKPAAPTVERATVWVDTVKRGSMVRQVRGLGTLVPEDTRWLPATTLGRVERIVLRPGAEVRPDSVILELSNPQVEQEAINARLALQAADANLANLRVQLQNELLAQQAGAATVQADYTQARLQAEVNEELAKQQLISELVRKQSQVRAEELKTRNEIEGQRLATAKESIEARIRVQQAAVDQARAIAQLNERRLADLKVRPGFSGVLQQVPVDVGQQVAPGQNLARVADPGRLKAELKIAETQAKDIEIGQVAQVDTRNGIIPGRVIRKDPAATNGTVTVDVGLTGALPRGAVPDLSVDGTVELERLENVLYVGRPAFGQEQSTVGLFKITNGAGDAERVQVRLGRSSVNTVEIVSGLNSGEQVVLSDMSAWDAFDRVRLR